MKWWSVLAAAMLVPPAAHAEVAAVAPAGFTVNHETVVAASPTAVFERIVAIGGWWSSDHSWFGDAAKMTLEPRAGGCWCEVNGAASAEHGRVILAQPGRLLRLDAALGPLQEMAVTGVLSFTLASADGGTKLSVTYVVNGLPGDMPAALAPAVDGVVGAQVARLAAGVETAE